jgi:uncharacterized Zn finger protein (UPF0148 family)
MDGDVTEVEFIRPGCRECGKPRPRGHTYCDTCKAARLRVQRRDQQRRHRARIKQQEAIEAAQKSRETEKLAKADQKARRREWLRERGF